MPSSNLEFKGIRRANGSMKENERSCVQLYIILLYCFLTTVVVGPSPTHFKNWFTSPCFISKPSVVTIYLTKKPENVSTSALLMNISTATMGTRRPGSCSSLTRNLYLGYWGGGIIVG